MRQRSYFSVMVLDIFQYGALILVVGLPGKCLAFLAGKKKKGAISDLAILYGSMQVSPWSSTERVCNECTPES